MKFNKNKIPFDAKDIKSAIELGRSMGYYTAAIETVYHRKSLDVNQINDRCLELEKMIEDPKSPMHDIDEVVNKNLLFYSCVSQDRYKKIAQVLSTVINL